MIKKFILALAISAGLLSSAHAAGTIPLSMTQQFDQFGVPLSGCQLYTIQAGTTSTPQNAYKDTALTPALVQPNPMICDSSGRLPQFFLADGQIKIRLLDKLGNPQVVLDNILVIGPSSGGGSGATIDPTTIASTGDLKHSYGTQVITGWVRFNGRTIGNATSGATERANSDTQALFLYLWATDATLAVSGGRTTAAADYAANKTITLPDARGRVLSGLDNMGSTAAGRLTGAYFGACTGGANGLTLGNVGGCENWTLVNNQLPTTTPHFNGSATSVVVVSDDTNIIGGTAGSFLTNGSVTGFNAMANGSITQGQRTSRGTITPNGFIDAFGGSQPHPTVPPTILVTIYIKL